MSGGDRHHGVVVVARNPSGTRFLVQQKDADYRAHPGGYSLFGGAVEAGEGVEAALARELAEELGPEPAAALLAGQPARVAEHRLADARLSVFEVVVGDASLDAIAASPVLEGERACVVTAAQLRSLAFIWALPEVLAEYLDRLDRRLGR